MLRRLDFPEITMRETVSGRVAYLEGTRFAVYWNAGLVPAEMLAEAFAQEFDVAPEGVRAAIAYANAFPGEIRSDREQVATNRTWIEAQDAGARAKLTPSRSRDNSITSRKSSPRPPVRRGLP